MTQHRRAHVQFAVHVYRKGFASDVTYPIHLNTCYKKFLFIYPWRWDQIGCPETSIGIYHYTLRNSPVERRAHLLPGGNPKSRDPRLHIPLGTTLPTAQPARKMMASSAVPFTPAWMTDETTLSSWRPMHSDRASFYIAKSLLVMLVGVIKLQHVFLRIVMFTRDCGIQLLLSASPFSQYVILNWAS